LIFILAGDNVFTQNTTEVDQENSEVTETAVTSADCLAYVYVTWIFFVYSIGLGAEQSEYPQLLSTAYALVPSQCGGYFTSSPVLPPTSMLSLLISTMTSTATTTTMGPSLFNIFPSFLLGNGARGGLSSIGNARGGLGRKKKARKNRDSVFKEGMSRMAGQLHLTKYIGQLGRPLFKADGSIELDLKMMKGRKGRKFCRELARSMGDVKQICKRIRKMRKKDRKRARGSKKQGKGQTRKGKQNRTKKTKKRTKKSSQMSN